MIEKAISSKTATEFQLDKIMAQCRLEIERYQVIMLAERTEGALKGERYEYGLWKIQFME